jgi:anthranilate phosphoribosyltransferase
MFTVIASPAFIIVSNIVLLGLISYQIAAMSASTAQPVKEPEKVSIRPLLERLAYQSNPNVEVVEASAEEIASTFALIFENRLSIVQCSSLLTLLHSTRKDQDPDVIAKCAQRMREAAASISLNDLKAIVKKRGRKEGSYRGGFVRDSSLHQRSHCTYLS